MKYKHHLFVVIYFLIVAICNAMENKDSLVIEEITTIKRPHYVQYLRKKRVAIGQECGITHILDLKTKKTQPLTAHQTFLGDFILQSDDKKIVTSAGQKITIYDEKTGKQEWTVTEPDEFGGFVFNSRKNLIFLSGHNKIIKYDYITNKRKQINSELAWGDCYPSLALHPKQDILCTIDKASMFLYKLDDLTTKYKTISLPPACRRPQYSSTGDYIVVSGYGYDKVFIIDPNKDEKIHPCIELERDERFDRMLFHSEGLVLAALCHHTTEILHNDVLTQDLIRFWDIKTQKLIWQTPAFDSNCIDFSFSDDGCEMMLVFKNKCVRMRIPFAIKKYLFPLFVLNQIRTQNNLPDDLKYYLMHTLIETRK